MSVEHLRLRLTGERPLLMHSSRLADPLDPVKIDLDRLTKKRDKTLADHEQIATFISYKVARSRLDRLRFVTQDPLPTLALIRQSRL